MIPVDCQVEHQRFLVRRHFDLGDSAQFIQIEADSFNPVILKQIFPGAVTHFQDE